MYGSRSFIIFWNCARSSDCARSLMALSDAGCTSTISPSASIATPVRESAGTRLRFPVAWLGSRITGRCVNSFSAGIAAMSQVFRVTVSNVRIPRSHKITSAFPCAVMYSADIRSSFTVLLSPRFNSTGRPHFPSAFSSMKFCMFRAPTCITSAYFATKSTSRSLITSVIIASPDFRSVDLDPRLPRAEFLAYKLVRRRNPHHLLNLRHGFDGFETSGHIPYPHDADHHALLPFDGVHLVAEVLHLFSNFVDLFALRVQFHGDDHFPGPRNLFLSPKTKNPLGWRVGRIFFLLIPLTETPLATWMCAK